ncbi:MAG: DNA polymerase III subunit delta [Betaproteobacteria bacterium]|nr:DNA polymerase III subunit delta [Betaproteobacteria bacterium]
MQVRPEQLEAQLARGLKPLYTIHGDEPLLAQEAGDAIRAAARAAGYAERQVFTVSGAHFDWSGVLGAARAMSLFAERRLIEIRIPSGKPGKEGSEALQRYCERLPEDVLTLVSLPRLDFSQQKAAWFGALDAAGATLRVETLDRKALPAWLAQRLARQGQRVREGDEGQRTLAFFADRVEGNLLAAHQEIQKLALLHPPGELSFEQVEAAVLNVARFDVTKLSEAVWTGNVARALRVLEGLQHEGEAAVLVHWTLADDIRALARGRAALDDGKPLPLALKEARAWGLKERLFERVLPLLAGHQMAHLLEAASVCDGIVKGLKHPEWPQAPWDALRRLVLMSLQPARSGTPLRRLALQA